jgi:hypothetical protein
MTGKDSDLDGQPGILDGREHDGVADDAPDAAATREKLNQALIQVSVSKRRPEVALASSSAGLRLQSSLTRALTRATLCEHLTTVRFDLQQELRIHEPLTLIIAFRVSPQWCTS